MEWLLLWNYSVHANLHYSVDSTAALCFCADKNDKYVNQNANLQLQLQLSGVSARADER